jgi:hypothetical protein
MDSDRKRQPAPQQQQRAEGNAAQQGAGERKPAKSPKFIEQQGWRGDGVVGDSHTD